MWTTWSWPNLLKKLFILIWSWSVESSSWSDLFWTCGSGIWSRSDLNLWLRILISIWSELVTQIFDLNLISLRFKLIYFWSLNLESPTNSILETSKSRLGPEPVTTSVSTFQTLKTSRSAWWVLLCLSAFTWLWQNHFLPKLLEK